MEEIRLKNNSAIKPFIRLLDLVVHNHWEDLKRPIFYEYRSCQTRRSGSLMNEEKDNTFGYIDTESMKEASEFLSL